MTAQPVAPMLDAHQDQTTAGLKSPDAASVATPPAATHRVLPVLCLLIGLAALQDKAQAQGETPPRLARVVEAAGRVWVLDRETRSWLPVGRNHPLTQGDRVLTDRDARAEVAVGSTTLRVDTQTELEFLRLDRERVDLHLHTGSLAVRVQSPRVLNGLAWATDLARFTPLRPGHYRVDHTRPEARQGLTYAATWVGQMRVQQAGADVWTLDGGQRAEIRRDGRSARTVSSTGAWPRDAFADWIADRDRDEGLSLDDLGAGYAQGSDDTWETTGWNELQRHGAWDAHPDFGRVWTPRHVPYGWAPYRDGRWAWISPWGWSWVDNTPWGFVPAHAGQWVWWRDRWVWAPGGIGARPVPRPPPHPGPRPVPTGPIAYTPDGVPAGIITVPADVLAPRPPISGPRAPTGRAEPPRVPGARPGGQGMLPTTPPVQPTPPATVPTPATTPPPSNPPVRAEPPRRTVPPPVRPPQRDRQQVQ